jgi:pimeloyl-ACP methyl ester carboxylesterase
VAPDLRGFNRSSRPPQVEHYRAPALIGDLVALIEQLGAGKACVVAHDWGGALAWGLASMRPDLVDKLVILNAPHPITFSRALLEDPEQREASQYMNWLRRPGSEQRLAADDFARLDGFFLGESKSGWFDPPTRTRYHEAWSQPGALTGGVNYYRASPMHPPTDTDPGVARLKLDESNFYVRMPTLVIWGEEDSALRPVLLDGLDRLVENLQIERLPQASHWLIHEHPQQICGMISRFLQA